MVAQEVVTSRRMRLAATRDLNQVPKHQFQEIVWQIEATTKWLDRAALLAFGALLSVIRGHNCPQ